MSEKNAKPAAVKAQAASASQLPFDPQYIGRIAGILLAICIVTALLLGIVNQITAPKIDAIQKAKKETAMAQVLPADEYESWPEDVSLPGDDSITGLYAANVNGSAIGWIVEVTAIGSQGPITMMVGMDMTDPWCKVTGVSVITSSETPNIGTKVVNDQSVLDRFIGMSHERGEITVNIGANRFDAVSGATVSSRGVTAGVNAALDAIVDLYASSNRGVIK